MAEDVKPDEKGTLSQTEILKILSSGDLLPLIGQFESEILECKGQPYGLDSDEQKLELAKDVSALANAEGGLILIGFSTKKNPTHGQDEIDRSRPFPLASFNADQYRQVIRSWLWPPLDSDVRTFSLRNDDSRGVAAIMVPRAADENRPQLVAKTILDGPRKIEIILGFCERKQSHVTHHDAARLHSLIRDGLRFDNRIRPEFDVIRALIENLGTPLSRTLATPENIDQRIQDALAAVGRLKKPAFVLASIPQKALNLRPLFESRDTPLVSLLEQPPRLRRSGFDLYTGAESRIIEGRLRRAMVENHELLEFHRDGVVTYIAPGDGDRLCWGQKERRRETFPINQMALVEMTYLFCKLTQSLYESHLEAGDKVELQMQILRLKEGRQNFHLDPGPLGSFSIYAAQPAPNESGSFKAEIQFGVDSPERSAVLLLSELYSWIGFEEELIPYTHFDGNVRVVDPNEIIRAGS